METIKGELELDKRCGVVWFKDENGMCRLRISDLTRDALNSSFIDIRATSPILCRKCGKVPVEKEEDMCAGCMSDKGEGNDPGTAKEE